MAALCRLRRASGEITLVTARGGDNVNDYLNKTTINARGWTDAGIKRFLGGPDKEAKNPKGRNAPTIKLFLKSRVECVERTDAFKDWKKKSERRRQKAKEKNAEKADAFLKRVSEINVDFSVNGDLLDKAIDHFNVRIAEKERRDNQNYDDWGADKELQDPDFEWIWRDYSRATRNSDKEFLDRITVNYLRHQSTKYDAVLDGFSREYFIKTDKKEEAYQILRKNIFDAMIRQFPELSDEINKQLERG